MNTISMDQDLVTTNDELDKLERLKKDTLNSISARHEEFFESLEQSLIHIMNTADCFKKDHEEAVKRLQAINEMMEEI